MANSLVELIRQRKAQIAKLQAELDEALTELTKARGQIAAATVALTKAGGRPARKRAAKGHPARGSRKVGQPGIISTSSVGLTVEVLRRAGKPLDVDDIIREIEHQGHKVKKTTLVGNLSRYVQEKQVFYRAAPGVYGLLELRR